MGDGFRRLGFDEKGREVGVFGAVGELLRSGEEEEESLLVGERGEKVLEKGENVLIGETCCWE